MNTRSERLRGYIQRLLESHAAPLWQHLPQADGIVQALVETLTREEYLQHTPPLGPTQYILGLPPTQSEALRQNSHLLDTLALAIHKAGNDIGLRFAVLPRVLLESRTDLPPQGFTLEAVFWEPEALKAVPLDAQVNIPPTSAYLIINGTQVFSLEQPLVHIGRRPDNDLVLDDPRISRLHAQLRANRGRFMLFDLNSTGGTVVNGKRITATILYPGDVITLAGTTLVYGQRATRPLQENTYESTRPHVVNLNTTVTLRRSVIPNDEQEAPSQE